MARAVRARARGGRFVGVDEGRYPTGLASFVEHTTALDALSAGAEPPPALALADVDAFARARGGADVAGFGYT